MPVLLLRLTGPMQSWGTQSRFSIRDTGREPSKSGVVGLLAAALGIRRGDHEAIARLASMKMGVRVDREGTMAEDFQTAGGGTFNGSKYGVAKASGAAPDTTISSRYYLADADFLVGFEDADAEWLNTLDAALRNPVWPLFLGRRSYVPGVPPPIGVSDSDLFEVLNTFPWRPRNERDKFPERGLRIVIDSDDEFGQARADYPVSFEKMDRRFTVRRVSVLRADAVTVQGRDTECTCPE